MFRLVCIVLAAAALVLLLRCPHLCGHRVPFHEAVERMKTGDVITKYGCDPFRSLLRLRLGCRASHVAMVVKGPDGAVEVVEMFAFHNMRTRKMREFAGENGSFSLTPIPVEITWTAHDIAKYGAFQFWMDPFPFRPNATQKVCSTFVAMVHADKGVPLPLALPHAEVTPCHFAQAPGTFLFSGCS